MTPDYAMMQQLLDKTLPDMTPAALHGLITGLLVSGAPDIDEEDIAALLDCEFAPVMAQLTAKLIGTTRDQLQQADYSFQPLLPLDDEQLVARVQALGHWCESFTNGFSAGFVEADSALGDEGREALTDIAQFASLSDEIDDDIEDEETDYMELVEYVRMATMTLFHQLFQQLSRQLTPARAPDDDAVNLDDQILH
ncbi:MAG TPA: UPF0149 family protein [Candidatus Acidoferrum sp.]|nr:UPF0149 family protein [Candidatus Acidoferrum sp.]